MYSKSTFSANNDNSTGHEWSDRMTIIVMMLGLEGKFEVFFKIESIQLWKMKMIDTISYYFLLPRLIFGICTFTAQVRYWSQDTGRTEAIINFGLLITETHWIETILNFGLLLLMAERKIFIEKLFMVIKFLIGIYKLKISIIKG